MLSRKNSIYLFFTLLFVCFAMQSAQAHATVDLSKYSQTDVGLIYLKLGFEHIIPLGLDHILFVLCLFFLNSNLKTVIWQATAFTVAHSITLGLAIYSVIEPPSHIVEPIIALTIAFIAVENILVDKLKPSRIIIVFIFGLIHGMGFAGVLSELGLPSDKFVTALLTFNVGVEFGQLAVIIGAWLLVGVWFHKKEWYRKRIVIPISAVIALIALYWTIERTFFS